MRPRRFNRIPFSQILQRFERALIRYTVLAAVLLLVVQIGFGLATDPVKLYITMAQKVEAPVLDLSPTETKSSGFWEGDSGQLGNISLKATPAAPVKVIVNGRLVGDLSKGRIDIPAQVGIVQIDGRNLNTRVRVQVNNIDPRISEPKLNQSFSIENNVQIFRISP